MLLDTRLWQWIRKYSWTPACDSQFENTPRHPCDSHFPKGISALSWSLPLEHWNKKNVNHVNSVHHVNSVNSVNTVNSVNSVNSYSAVLPPSRMVFFLKAICGAVPVSTLFLIRAHKAPCDKPKKFSRQSISKNKITNCKVHNTDNKLKITITRGRDKPQGSSNKQSQILSFTLYPLFNRPQWAFIVCATP